jgi:hypothetical protein
VKAVLPTLLALAIASAILAGAAHGQELDLLRAAAEAGEPGALFALAEMHERGGELGQDLSTAVELYRLAAERGHPEAQYRVGLALTGGFGGPRDPEQGLVWLTLAATATGHDVDPLAGALRDAAAAQYDATTLADVERRAAAFRAVRAPASLPPSVIGEANPMARLRAFLPEDHCEPMLEVRQAGGGHRFAVFTGGDDGSGTPSVRPISDGLRPSVLAPELCATLRLLDHAGVIDPELSPILRGEDRGPKVEFVDGDYLVIEIPPQARDGRVALDYFAHDGNVLHMLPQPGHAATTAGETLVLGAADTVPRWQVSQPFGDDLLVVWWSTAPPPGARRPQVETIERYLPALRDALSGNEPVRAGFQIVHTAPG